MFILQLNDNSKKVHVNRLSSDFLLFSFLLLAPAEQDDVLIVDSDEEEPSSSTMDVRMESGGHKRKLHDAETGEASAKRQRLDQPSAADEDDDDIIALDQYVSPGPSPLQKDETLCLCFHTLFLLPNM